MILLTSTSDLLKVVTGSALTIDVYVSWVDNAAGTITPGRTNTAITTATTTTVVASPGSSTQRSVQVITIANKDTASQLVTVQHYDGTTTVQLCKVTILAGELLMYTESEGFRTVDATGSVKLATPTNAFTAGSVVYVGANGSYAQDNATFFWDTSNKRLGVNTATPSVALDVRSGQVRVGTSVGVIHASESVAIKNSTGGSYGIVGYQSASTGASYASNVDTSGQVQFQFFYQGNATGNISDVGSSSCAYNATSDRRLKENIETYKPDGEALDRLRVVGFDWKKLRNPRKEDRSPVQHSVGLIAQEVVQIVPEIVCRGDDDETAQRGDKHFTAWSMDYSRLVPYLLAEIQSMRQRISALEGVSGQ
jgi:hypothetical protein